jgi:translocation and assembly module TamA
MNANQLGQIQIMIRQFSLLAAAACICALLAQADPLRIVSETASEELQSELRSELAEDADFETVFEARRHAIRTAERAKNYLNSRGYFSPEIDYRVDTSEPPQIQLRIEPGPQYTFAAITVDTGEMALSDEAKAALSAVRTLTPGDVVLPSAVLAEETGLVVALKTAGYADAKPLERSVIGDREAGTLDLSYRINSGPRIRFGKVIYPKTSRTRHEYLDRLIPFEQGELYTPQKLATLSRRLNATRLYRLASVQLSETATDTTPEGDEVRDVILQLEETERYTLTTGASFSTSEGPGLTAGLISRNTTQRGDTLTAALTLATLERAFNIDWRIPNVTAFDRTLVLSADIGREDTDAFDRDAITLTGALEIRSSRHLTYAFEAGSEFTREEDAFEQRDQQILSTSVGVRLDYADDPLDATSGWRVDARGEPGLVLGDRQTQFFSLNGQVSAYQSLDQAKRLVAAARIRSGFVFGASLPDLPVSRRFFAGGGGSARGFEYQSVGPEDANGTPTGGRGLLEVSGELRWRRDEPLGFVAFLDGASVSADQGLDFEDIRYSAGLGVRYDTLVGPIRLDLATPIDPRPGDDTVQVYISIGQAF